MVSANSCYTGSRERHVSLPKPYANRDVNEWFKRFDICCKANGWNAATSALKLPTLLEGEALTVWLELSEEQQGDYAATKKEICTAMMPMEFVSLDGFHQRKLRPGEPISVFVHELKQLLHGTRYARLRKASKRYATAASIPRRCT